MVKPMTAIDETRSAPSAVAVPRTPRSRLGSVLPALPFVFGTSLACILASVGITLLASAVIGHYRGYLVTYAILIVVSALTVGLSVAVT